MCFSVVVVLFVITATATHLKRDTEADRLCEMENLSVLFNFDDFMQTYRE